MKRIDRSIIRFDNKLKALLMANNHNQVTALATDGIGGYNITTYGKDMSSFTICIPTKMKEKEIFPCFVSHTDTVSAKKPKRFELHEGVLSNPDGVLGADDRAGVYILSKMMEKGVRGIYIFTNGEEIGGLGARACAVSQPFQDLIPNISAFLELDRQDDKDIALYGYDNDALCLLFEKLGYEQVYGSYTDVVDFSQETGIACLNLSVGYDRQHSKHETLNLAHLDFTLDNMLNHLPLELYEKVYLDEGEHRDYSGDYSWTTQKIAEVECEICGIHDKLYWVEDTMLCGYCCDVQEIEEEPLVDGVDDDSWYNMNWNL